VRVFTGGALGRGFDDEGALINRIRALRKDIRELGTGGSCLKS
jgi:hypothetical protein